MQSHHMKHWLGLVTALSGGVALNVPAFAQDSGGGAGSADRGLEEVVVTARNRSERGAGGADSHLGGRAAPRSIAIAPSPLLS